MSKRVRVKVPATTANLGPGFDCLGIALQISNLVTVEKSAAPQKDAMVADAANSFFRASKSPRFRFSWQIEGDVPRSRGLGSSVTVRLGILHGLNALCGNPLSSLRLYEICASLEGHPDNAAPAAFGGFTVARSGFPVQRFAVAKSLKFVLLIPGFEISTPAARKVLPKTITLPNAARTAANAAAIAAAFASRDYAQLPGAFEDWLHQPFRAKLIPCLGDVLAAGRKAGALGGWLSGSGSTIACLTLEPPARVATAMLAASGLKDATTLTTRADNLGVRVLS